MAPPLHNGAPIEHEDFIRMHDSGQAVCDHQSRATATVFPAGMTKLTSFKIMRSSR